MGLTHCFIFFPFMFITIHEPVEILNLGMMAKMDLVEIRMSFIESGILAGGSTFS
jgi:hypothetical protein